MDHDPFVLMYMMYSVYLRVISD